jgi:hypothetical protein
MITSNNPNGECLRALLLSSITLGLVGCTHQSLARNTVLTTTTVMEIQYGSVLSNLAMMSKLPESLPNHVHLADGVVQINDRVGLGQAGGFSLFNGANFGFEQLGPSGQRQVSEQWGTDATTDPERLHDLQSLYRVALGLHPLPPPNAIAYLRSSATRKKLQNSKASAETEIASDNRSTESDDPSENGNEDRAVPLSILLTDVPISNWYHIGCKKDVPKDACYVGQWGDRYAWVNADGVPHLARFTATVLMVIKLKPGEGGRNNGGLAVTTN